MQLSIVFDDRTTVFSSNDEAFSIKEERMQTIDSSERAAASEEFRISFLISFGSNSQHRKNAFVKSKDEYDPWIVLTQTIPVNLIICISCSIGKVLFRSNMLSTCFCVSKINS
jgi:hypothetical protein